MPLLLETIRIEGYKAANLTYHQKRFDQSRKALFGLTDTIDLVSQLQAPTEALYRCRILYDRVIRSIEYIPYLPREIQTLKIINIPIDYTYKYAERKPFDRLLNTYTDHDEIIIEKEGFLTDTTIANLAFYDGKQWFTPEKPLLEGTMRAKLLDDGFIHKKPVKREDLTHYSHVALMNAMIGFKILNKMDIS